VVNSLTKRQAVIFDVDGVLVDSYEAHLRSWQSIAREEGVKFTEDDFAASFGRTSREIVQRCWGIDDEVRIRAIDDRKESLYRQIVAAHFPVMDGATELIDALKSADFALAMGSSGPPENLQVALDGLGRRDAFSAIVSGMDVHRGKPEPEVFLVAAKRLGVPPSLCAVVEDAPAGVQAAHAAGMACVVLLSRGRKAADFAGLQPQLMVHSLRDLTPELIGRLIAST